MVTCKMKKETKTRSVVKSITWRMLATITTIILVKIFTGNLKIAISVGFVETLSKLMIFYVHERTWTQVRWGTN